MRSDPFLRVLPEMLALFGLAMTPALPAMAMHPQTMDITICTGGQTRTVTIEVGGKDPFRGDDCPRACHAICERKRQSEKRTR